MPPSPAADATLGAPATPVIVPSAQPGFAARAAWFLAGPVVLGGLSGLAAAWSTPVYWTLQAVGIAGALFTSPAQSRRRALGTGALGGFAFGVALLVVLTATTRPEVVDLGDPREFHAIATLVAGALLTWGGAAIARRNARRAASSSSS